MHVPEHDRDRSQKLNQELVQTTVNGSIEQSKFNSPSFLYQLSFAGLEFYLIAAWSTPYTTPLFLEQALQFRQMLTHRGFSAWIEVGEKRVPEYLVAVDSTTHQVSCWIPGEAGQTFSVYWRDHGGRVDTCTFITLDGYVVPGRFLRGQGIGWRGGVRTSDTTERPFMFQKVEENVADTNPAGQDVSKNIGKIILRIKRIRMVSVHPPNPVQELPEYVVGNFKVGELRVGFGDEKPFYSQYKSTWSVEAYDDDEDQTGSKQPSTYVSFVFRYRSRDFLEAQGIVEENKPEKKLEKKPDTKLETKSEKNSPIREPVRRVASVPPCISSLLSPSPSPHKKVPKTKLAPTFYRAGPYRLRRPSADLRRTVSWRLTDTERKTTRTYEEGYTDYPRETLPPFADIVVEDEAGSSTSGLDTPTESSPDSYPLESSPNYVYDSTLNPSFDYAQLHGEMVSSKFF